MAREIINTEKAPAAIGPYVQAVADNGLLFISGQLGFDVEHRQRDPGNRRRAGNPLFKESGRNHDSSRN